VSTNPGETLPKNGPTQWTISQKKMKSCLLWQQEKPGGHRVNSNKLDAERQTLRDLTHMWNLKGLILKK
jgi:hypothetical protein